MSYNSVLEQIAGKNKHCHLFVDGEDVLPKLKVSPNCSFDELSASLKDGDWIVSLTNSFGGEFKKYSIVLFYPYSINFNSYYIIDEIKGEYVCKLEFLE